MTRSHTLSMALICFAMASRGSHMRWPATRLIAPVVRYSLLCCLLMGGVLIGDPGAAFSQVRTAQAANDTTASVISEVKDIGPMRAAQQRELNAARAELKGDNRALRQRAAEIKQKYLQQDRRGKYTDEVVKKYGGKIENTGSNPKDVRADVDLAAKNKVSADRLTQEWKAAGHHIEDHGYKVVNKTTDTTLWKPCNTPDCLAAKVRDPDAWTTEGGLKATGNTDRIRDPRGQYLDNAKKFFHAKEDFAHATADPQAIDELKTFESVKTAAKSLDKAAEAAGIKQNDEFWQKIENIRKQYMDPWEAGIADPNDPPAKQVKDIEKFLADAETKMASAEEVLTRRGQAIDQQVREKLQQDLKNAKQSDPKNKAMDQEGAEAIKARRDKVKASNEAVEDLLTQQGAKQPGASADAPDGGAIQEPVRTTETGEVPPKAGTQIEEPPVIAGSEPVPVTEQPGAAGAAGAESGSARSAAAVAKSVAAGAAIGSLLGSATTYLTCIVALSPDATNANCLAAAGQSIPEAGFWGAVAALGTVGEVAAAIYGTYATGVAVKEAIEEANRLPGALEAEMKAASRFDAAQVAKQEEISRARKACNYERALGLAEKLRRQRPRPSWLAATMPKIKAGADAQKAVTILLTRAAKTSDQASKAELLGLAHNIAAGVPCLQKKVQVVRDKLEPARTAKTPAAKAGGKDCDPNKVASKRRNSDGFAPVEYKGATAWTGDYNPDCAPYGPAAKGTNDGLTKPESKPPVDKTAQACSEADAALAQARKHYLAGRVTWTRVALSDAERAIDAKKDSKACAGQRVKIAKNREQANLLEKVIKTADKALKDCRPQQMKKLSGMLDKTNHPHVVQLRGRVDRMVGVTVKVDEADAKLADGNKASAETLYREAAADLNVDAGACRGLAQRVRDAQARIHTASLASKPDITELTHAENRCRSTLGARGLAVPDPDSLSGFTCDCADPYMLVASACVRKKSTTELAEAAHKVCRDQFGRAAYAQSNGSDYKQYGCLCGKGYVWNNNKTQCVQQTREQVIADANRRCQIANKNRRARASKYLGSGQWSCVVERSRAQVVADAHRACQRANHNRRARAVKPIGNGRWSCRIPGQRRVKSQPNYDAAASAAAAAAIIQGLGAVMQSQTSRVPSHSSGGCRPGAVGGVFRDCHGRLNR